MILKSENGNSRKMRSMTSRIVAIAAVSATIGAAALPAFGLSRPANYQLRPQAFHLTLGANGIVSRNVCSYAINPGVTHCNASKRVDAFARHLRPLRTGIVQPLVIGNGGAYDPAYLQSAYNVASLASSRGAGVGQTVAIVDAYDNPNLASDLAYYRNYFHETPCPVGVVSKSNTSCVFQKVNENGASSPLPAGNSSWGVETSLDIQMVSAICPNCQILLLEANTANISDLGAAVNTAATMGVAAVSNSYGSMEYNSEVDDATFYYDHPGLPVTVSSGDSGYGVEFPAASPFVTAVGGTTLVQSTNSGTRNGSETVWSGAGAGCSSFEPKPAWQHDTGCANRTVSDVSAIANPSSGVWVYDTYGSSGFGIYGGTSVAAPIIASIYALAANPAGGAAVPASYAYGSPSSLYSVTSGNDGSCGTYLCNAGFSQNGYNGPTGLGTPGGSPNSLSAFSSLGNVTTAPGAPLLKSATPSNGSVSLSWNTPTNSGGSVVTGYNIFVGATPGGESLTPSNSSLVSSTGYNVGGLTNGTKYYFTVTAINSVGSSPSSNELSATPTVSVTVPGAPGLNLAAAANTAVALAWSAPSNTGGGITGYNVFIGTVSGGESTTPVNSSLITGTSYSAGSLNNGTTYYFNVKAVNSAGSSSASNQLSAKPATVPGAPSTLTARSDRRLGVDLAWRAPSSNGGSAVTSYLVLRGSSSGSELAYVTVSCTNSSCSYVDNSTTRSVTYYYVVVANNSIGASTKSNEAFSSAR